MNALRASRGRANSQDAKPHNLESLSHSTSPGQDPETVNALSDSFEEKSPLPARFKIGQNPLSIRRLPE